MLKNVSYDTVARYELTGVLLFTGLAILHGLPFFYLCGAFFSEAGSFCQTPHVLVVHLCPCSLYRGLYGRFPAGTELAAYRQNFPCGKCQQTPYDPPVI